MNPISILIADDHTLIRQAWTFLLSTHSCFCVVGESSTGQQTIEAAGRLHPDIVLMDINMPDGDGVEATRQVRRVSPATKVIGVTTHTQPAFARQMLKNGAMGFVTKTSSATELIAAIHAVHRGSKYICQEIKENIAREVFDIDNIRSALHSLTHREKEVIELVKEGWSSQQIGKRLGISEKTVEVHRHRILKKLKLKNTVALVNLVNEHQSTVLIW